MHLVLLAVGDNVRNHFQAFFTLLTFLRSPSIERVSIITDAAGFYRVAREDTRVRVLEVNRKMLTRWKGPHDFFWRIKIKAIAHAHAEMPNLHVLYVDGDTFLYATLEDIKAGLDRGTPYMHLPEITLAEGSYKTIRGMWQDLAGKTVLGYQIDERTAMWNAGVIAMPAGEASGYIDETLALCDALTGTSCKRSLLEQLAFSMALGRNGKLTASDRVIGHYWGNKDAWNAAIQPFLLSGFMEGKSLVQLTEASDGFDFFAHPVKGGGYKKTARRLHSLVDRLVPRKPKTFFRESH